MVIHGLSHGQHLRWVKRYRVKLNAHGLAGGIQMEIKPQNRVCFFQEHTGLVTCHMPMLHSHDFL